MKPNRREYRKRARRRPSHAPRNVAVVVTNRANYGRVLPVLLAIRHHPALKLQLIAAASALVEDSGSLKEYISRDGFEIAGCAWVEVEQRSSLAMAHSTGTLASELAEMFSKLRPDIVMAIADRHEILSVAIAGAYMNIPVAHLLGGELSGSIDEKVRHAITKLSDLHFVANRSARNRLIRMGEPSRSVYVTGCPSMDLALPFRNRHRAPLPDISEWVERSHTPNLASPYLILVQHPVTSQQDECFKQAWETLQAVGQRGIQTLMFLPNIDAGSGEILRAWDQFRRTRQGNLIYPCRNMPPETFLRLLANSACVVGNSSVGIRECSFLGVPAVNIGTRQIGRERGRNVLGVPHDRFKISRAIFRQLGVGRYRPENLYGDGHAGPRIAEILSAAKLSTEKSFAE